LCISTICRTGEHWAAEPEVVVTYT
jgi:hypothetical protein